MDFYKVIVRKLKDGTIEVKPDFINSEDVQDLMIRGNDFYAVFDEQTGMWKRNPLFVQKVIDKDLWEKYDELKRNPMIDPAKIEVKTMLGSSSGSWDRFVKYVKKLPDNFHQLDEKLTFQDTVTKRTDYASKRLSYSICEGDISAYEEMMSTLYEPVIEQEDSEVYCILWSNGKW